MRPRRIQRSRRKGWRMPAGAVYVGRPSRWGNPFPLDGDWITWAAVALGYRADANGRRGAALALYRAWLLSEPVAVGPLADARRGGAIKFADGSVVAESDHVRGIAGFMVAHTEAPPIPQPPSRDEIRKGLGGCCVAEWCALSDPCHADLLLAIANDWPLPDLTSRASSGVAA